MAGHGPRNLGVAVLDCSAVRPFLSFRVRARAEFRDVKNMRWIPKAAGNCSYAPEFLGGGRACHRHHGDDGSQWIDEDDEPVSRKN